MPAGHYFDTLCHGPLSPYQSFHTLSVHYDSVVHTAEKILFRYKISTLPQPEPTHTQAVLLSASVLLQSIWSQHKKQRKQCVYLCQIAIKKKLSTSTHFSQAYFSTYRPNCLSVCLFVCLPLFVKQFSNKGSNWNELLVPEDLLWFQKNKNNLRRGKHLEISVECESEEVVSTFH